MKRLFNLGAIVWFAVTFLLVGYIESPLTDLCLAGAIYWTFAIFTKRFYNLSRRLRMSSSQWHVTAMFVNFTFIFILLHNLGRTLADFSISVINAEYPATQAVTACLGLVLVCGTFYECIWSVIYHFVKYCKYLLKEVGV